MNHTLQFERWSTARHFWMAVHNMSALLFSVFLGWHIALNRKAVWRYTRALPGRLPSREALLGGVLVIGVVGVFSLHAFLRH